MQRGGLFGVAWILFDQTTDDSDQRTEWMATVTSCIQLRDISMYISYVQAGYDQHIECFSVDPWMDPYQSY